MTQRTQNDGMTCILVIEMINPMSLRNQEGFSLFSEKKDGDCVTCKCMEQIFNYLLSKKKSIKVARLFQVCIVTNKNTMVQFFHRDDSEFSCHVSGDYEGSWLKLCILIDEELCV